MFSIFPGLRQRLDEMRQSTFRKFCDFIFPYGGLRRRAAKKLARAVSGFFI
jgi:hypothetical protein